MENEDNKKFFEKVLKINEEHYTRFQRLIKLNRKRGRDYEVLQDYLKFRDDELKGTRAEDVGLYLYLKENRFNYFFARELGSHVEKKVKERLFKWADSPEKKYDLIKTIMQEWVDKQGHDQCWYYPEIFGELVEILDIKTSKEPSLPSRE